MPVDAKITDLTPLTDADRDRITALADRQRRANGLLMRAINFVGGQVEDTLKILPKAVRTQIDGAARVALENSYELAAKSRGGPVGQAVNTDRMHKVMATLSGALGGLGGLPTALAELPVATTMIFRAVQGVAAQYGEDPTSSETRLQALAVFGAGAPVDGKPADGIDTSFIGARLGLSGAAVHTLIGRVAPRFATVLTQKLASQAVPLLGAAAGAGTNYAFTQYYVEMAHVHFGLRQMVRTHGEDAVLDLFHARLGNAQVVARATS
ncbi:EcsC protein family protein [Loktanella fryxellensis]|uniref:EcsC protein family protein n=1 Tax=Loktanella fryxellensis TaxID=245187 RepID=A0A1H8FXE6_9RHOB|nr:EcsC family protein [Loktanella fryxellensis]SEN36205.1 EcsC protein family protein [Loktanella fryxellensis]